MASDGRPPDPCGQLCVEGLEAALLLFQPLAEHGWPAADPSRQSSRPKMNVGLDHLKHTLVAKLSGGRPPIQEVRQCFLTTWAPSGHCSIGAWDAKHILIVLNSEEDARKVLFHSTRKIGHSLFRIC
ncbi:hypothetical protein QQ045_004986 [Rhodiola kirilowii]